MPASSSEEIVVCFGNPADPNGTFHQRSYIHSAVLSSTYGFDDRLGVFEDRDGLLKRKIENCVTKPLDVFELCELLGQGDGVVVLGEVVFDEAIAALFTVSWLNGCRLRVVAFGAYKDVLDVH